MRIRSYDNLFHLVKVDTYIWEDVFVIHKLKVVPTANRE